MLNSAENLKMKPKICNVQLERFRNTSSYLESVDSGQTSDSSLSSPAVDSPEACSLNSPGDRDDNYSSGM